jgi:hypothetical protein
VIAPDRLRRRVEAELMRAIDNYRAEVTVAPPKKPKKVEPRKTAATAGRKN